MAENSVEPNFLHPPLPSWPKRKSATEDAEREGEREREGTHTPTDNTGDRNAHTHTAPLRELFKWYGERAKEYPEEKLSHITEVKKSMLGAEETGPLKAKAAETYGLVLFCLDLLQKHLAKIANSGLLLSCGRELVTVLNVMKRANST